MEKEAPGLYLRQAGSHVLALKVPFPLAPALCAPSPAAVPSSLLLALGQGHGSTDALAQGTARALSHSPSDIQSCR